MNEPTHQPTTALQVFREAQTQAIEAEDWLVVGGLDRAWQHAVDEVVDDGTRTPDELAEARAVVALHRAWP